MPQNLFDKQFRYTVVALLSALLLSVATFFSSILQTIAFACIAVAMLVLTVRSLYAGVLVVIAEVVVGSFGHLFTVTLHGQLLPIRFVLFGTLVVVWGIHSIRTRHVALLQHSLRWWFLVWAVTLVVGVVIALLTHQSLVDIYSDANGYVYFLLIGPLLDIVKTKKQVLGIVTTVFAGVVATTLLSLWVLAMFSHHAPQVHELYRWARDTRMFEIINVGANFYRVFSPTHIYGMFVLCIALCFLLFKRNEERIRFDYWFVLYCALLTVLMSLSRSIWLATLVGLGLTAILFVQQHRTHARAYGIAALQSIALCILVFSTLLLTINFPYFLHRPGAPLTVSYFQERSTDTEEAALVSRYDLLKPLARQIAHHPVIGTGFGTRVTFTTSDPHNVAVNHGIRSAFAFEWGYLDVAVKVGVLGLGVLLALLIAIARFGWRTSRQTTERGLSYGLFIAFLALCVTHAVTPYLNHPLGITFLALCVTTWTVLTADHTDSPNG